MTALLLTRALTSIPDPPCDVYACGQRARCASQGLACAAFRAYIAYGSRPPPTWRGQGRTLAREADPTREIYEAIYYAEEE